MGTGTEKVEKSSTYVDPPPDVVRAYIAQQQCWICGKGGWKALSQHLVKAHGLPAAEVRELAYMFKRERLISEELSEVMSKDALRRFGSNEGLKRFTKLRRFKKGAKQPKRICSTKQKDILEERVKEIRPLAAIGMRKLRRSHLCEVCGTLIETSKPIHCSPECAHIAHSASCREAMTPERIAQFQSIRHVATSEERSERAKRYWEKIKSWPIEKQREYNLERAKSRRVRVTQICEICGGEREIIPSQVGKIHTCGSNECKFEIKRRRGLGRKHTLEAIL